MKRSKAPKMNDPVRITIVIERDLAELFKEIERARGRTMSEAIRSHIEDDVVYTMIWEDKKDPSK